MTAITRREALRRIYAAIVAAGASAFISFEDLLAAESRKDPRVNVIWLHGSSCSGCSISLLNVETVSVIDILTRFTNLVFHPDVSLATGHQVVDIHERLAGSTLPYVLVLEGAIPTAMPHACLMGERPIAEWVDALARKAVACIGAGTCAALGGIPKMKGMSTGCMTLVEFLRARSIATPVVALPNCPMKPEHFVYVLLHYAKLGRPPELDARRRPKRFFAHTVHEKCIYYADFQEERFAERIGDPGCLLHLGCQGPVTRNDCSVLGHNGNINTCIRSGHPCVGCASLQFPRQTLLRSTAESRWIPPVDPGADET